MEPLGTIKRQDQLAALADEHRLALLRRLMCGPSTISKLGRDFGRHPAWIRHHLMRLAAVGLVEAAGEKTTRNYTEKFYRATSGALAVHMLVAPDSGSSRTVVALGSDDFAMQLLADDCNAAAVDSHVAVSSVGSLDGLIALRQGLADVAGCHLLDVASGEYNIPYLQHLFPNSDVEVVTLAYREQGLMTRAGSTLRPTDIADLAETSLRFINRNPGSGTRVWLDAQLRALGVDTAVITGWETEVTTHDDVARAIASGAADIGLGIRTAAEHAGLDFMPLFTERYDLVFSSSSAHKADLEPLREQLESNGFKSRVRALGGYDTTDTGQTRELAG